MAADRALLKCVGFPVISVTLEVVARSQVLPKRLGSAPNSCTGRNRRHIGEPPSAAVEVEVPCVACLRNGDNRFSGQEAAG